MYALGYDDDFVYWHDIQWKESNSGCHRSLKAQTAPWINEQLAQLPETRKNSDYINVYSDPSVHWGYSVPATTAVDF
jgi:DNA modification methylase